MPHLRLAAASALLLAICHAAPGQAQTPPNPVAKIGPSYTCKPGQEPLAQLICGDPALSRADLAFVQAYQALRAQSDPAGQAALWKEQVAFHDEVLARCAIPAAGNLPTATPAMISCVKAAYDRKRTEWLSQLHGAALEEASRPLADHIAAQRSLQTLGFLPPDAALDGVYGPAMRTGLRAFQRSVGQTPTGIMADSDAGALRRAVAATPPSPSTVEDSHIPYGRAHGHFVGGASLAPLSSLADWVGK